jgi:hypothetical protein
MRVLCIILFVWCLTGIAVFAMQPWLAMLWFSCVNHCLLAFTDYVGVAFMVEYFWYIFISIWLLFSFQFSALELFWFVSVGNS